MPGLFRPEATAAGRLDWLGNIRLSRPVSLAWLTAATVAVAMAVGAFLGFGQYTRKARVAGYLVPDRGVIRLVAPQSATVVESHAAEGRRVGRGEVLYVLDVAQSTLGGDTQSAVQVSLATRERSLEAAVRQHAELEQSERVAIDRQIDEMQRELTPMAVEVDLQTQRLGLAQQSLARLESLQKDNFISSAQVQAKAEEILGLKAQLQTLARQRAGHLRQIAALQAQRSDLPVRSKVRQGEALRELAELAQRSAENEARRRIVVRAPQDGTLTGVLAGVGQSVGGAIALASLVPEGVTLEAHLFAPSSAVGFVRPRQPVALRYQAFPYQKFGHQEGEVREVSRSPLQATELAALAVPPQSEPLYRITVTLARQSVAAYGQAEPLVPGMQLDADVLLDRRRLFEWIFEPVLGIAGRL